MKQTSEEKLQEALADAITSISKKIRTEGLGIKAEINFSITLSAFPADKEKK